MSTVVLIDYGMGNLDSVARAVEVCGGTPVVTCDEGDIKTAAAAILPGVGAFPDGMKELKARSLDRILREHVVDAHVPLLGICLGMQLLATKGFEGAETPGLGFIPGEVRRLESDTPGTRIPHVGWNEVHPEQDDPLFDGIPPGKDFYFVHSYHFIPDEPAHVVARTPYCGGFTSCIRRDLVFGTQFHPEKSQKLGLKLLSNFLAL